MPEGKYSLPKLHHYTYYLYADTMHCATIVVRKMVYAGRTVTGVQRKNKYEEYH